MNKQIKLRENYAKTSKTKVFDGPENSERIFLETVGVLA